MKGAPQLRLDRLLANLGYGSRREVQQLVRYGAVKLDGEMLADADAKIAVTADLSSRMRVEGKPLDPPPGVALMLHKPVGVTCSHKEAGQLVYDLLPSRWKLRDPAISTIGRLDKDTSGLLLLTDDGALLHRVISPKSAVTKRYQVTLDRPLNGSEVDIFMAGTLMLEGEQKPLLPVPMEVFDPLHAQVILTEGRYHQVRRMFAAVGNHVVALHRDRVGGLGLPDDLAPGQYRLLGDGDLDAVFGTNAAS